MGGGGPERRLCHAAGRGVVSVDVVSGESLCAPGPSHREDDIFAAWYCAIGPMSCPENSCFFNAASPPSPPSNPTGRDL